MSRRTVSVLCATALVAGLLAAAQANAALPGQGQIAFVTDQTGNDEIYSISPDGSQQRNLTNAPSAQDLDPAWSPDGQSIAFARHTTPLGGTHILIMGAAGRFVRVLTRPATIDRQPAWSPDGTKIAFTRGDESNGAFQIWVVGRDGSYLHPVTGATPHVFNGSPSWSPDGTKIAFVSDRAGGFPKVFVMNRDGTFAHQLSQGTYADTDPAWSPDGSMIAFARCCPNGQSSIFTMPSGGGTTLSKVTPDGLDASHPAWSPDGTKIAFAGFPSGGGGRNLYTIAPDGTGLTQLTNSTWSNLSPSWDPSTSSAPVSTPTLTATAVSTARHAVHRLTTSHQGTASSGASAKHKKKHKKKPKPYVRTTTTVVPGLTLTRIIDRRIPQRIFILRAQVQTTPVTTDVALSNNQLPGFETVQSMANRHHAIAGVNGDFGLSTGRPMNIYAEDGRLEQTMYGWGNNFAVSADRTNEFLGHPVENVTATVTSTGETWQVARVNEGVRPVFGEITGYTDAGGSLFPPPDDTCQARLSPDGKPPQYDSTGRAVVHDYVVTQAGCFAKGLSRGGGAVVLAANAADPNAQNVRALQPGQTVSLSWTLGWHRVLDTIGGFPMLLRDGKIVAQACSSGFCGRNPRTGVGFTSDGSVMLVVVDGRRANYSIGMTLTGFAREMRSLGAVTAMNLDGGGSSTMVVRGRVINSPSDPGGPRHVSSALLLLNGPDADEPASLHPEQSSSGTSAFGAPFATSVGLDPSAWRLAASDPGSTGGLVAALTSRAFVAPGFRLDPGLARILRAYRSR